MQEQENQEQLIEVIDLVDNTDKPSNQFRTKQELGGAIDQRINVKGQPRNQRPMGMTRRSNHQSELVSLLRKLKPNLSAAVVRTSAIVSNPNSKDADAVAAARLLLSTYQSLMQDLYKDSEKEETVTVVQELPKFSLQVSQ